MLQAARDEASSGFRPPVQFDEYEIFNDLPEDRQGDQPRGVNGFDPPLSHGNHIPHLLHPGSSSMGSSNAETGIESPSLESIESAVPSLDVISSFYRDVFHRSQMETDCIIMSLIYAEKLIRATNGGVRPRIGNWRSALFASMIMSSKVWDDLSMWNADFSQTCPSGMHFSLQRINELELAMLNCLKFDVKVPAGEYAKYYFLLRSMMIRSGLASGEDLSTMRPLDVKSARKLEVLSANFRVPGDSYGGKTKIERPVADSRRSKSYSEVDSRTRSPDGGKTTGMSPVKVSLEQVVHL